MFPRFFPEVTTMITIIVINTGSELLVNFRIARYPFKDLESLESITVLGLVIFWMMAAK